MADLTAADVTVTVEHKDLTHNLKMAVMTFALGDGAKTVPAGGVPLPDLRPFWMHHRIIELAFTSKGGSGFLFDFDRANHKIMVKTFDYDAGADGPAIAFTGALPATTLRALVYGK